MEIICLEIRTRDAAYGQVLQDVLKRSYRGFLIDLRIIEEDTSLKEQEGARWGTDLVLTDDPRYWIPGGVLLVDSPREQEQEGPGYRLFKYAPARTLTGQLLKICGEHRGRPIDFDEEGGRRIQAVASGAGGLGSTTLALTVARELASTYRKNTMYLSLEQFPSTVDYVRTESPSMPLREFLLRCLEHPEKPGLLSQAVARDGHGVGYFAYGKGENPLTTLGEEEIYTFFQYLRREQGYEELVIDVGNVLTQAGVAALRAAEEVYLLKGPKKRDEQYLAFLRHQGGSGLGEKMILVENQVGRDAPRDEKEALMEAFFAEEDAQVLDERQPDWRLPYDPASFMLRKDMLDIEPDGAFGIAVGDMVAHVSRRHHQEPEETFQDIW